jgi:hypothetical protein
MHAHPPELLPLSPVQSRDDRLGVRPGLQRGATAVSQLSDERSTSASEYDDAPEEKKEGKMSCKRCSGTAFGAKRSNDGGTSLCCNNCGWGAPA